MLLGVNIDHIATIRNARGGVEPDVVNAALLCEKAGCNAITVHLREDRRHIKDSDVENLKKILNVKMNLEMATTDEMLEIALKTRPYSCCLVPEKRQELTTEGGLDVVSQVERMKNYVGKLRENNIIVSLFVNTDSEQIQASSDVGAHFIELHTGNFANEFGTQNEQFEFDKLYAANRFAQNLGLKVNAGHGLNYENVSRMKQIPGLIELNIGHSIISRAVFVGLERAVLEMMDLVK